MPTFSRESEPEMEFTEHDLPPSERGRAAHFRGKRFEDEVATLYRLLGFEVTPDTQVSGIQIDLQIKKREGGMTTMAVVECKNTRISAKERDQLLAQQNVAQNRARAIDHCWTRKGERRWVPARRASAGSHAARARGCRRRKKR